MHICSDSACRHPDHTSPPFNHAVPVGEDDARSIDEARRSLIAMVHGSDMTEAPATLDMTVREINVPAGDRAMKIHTIDILFGEDAPKQRGQIREYLNGRFDASLALRRHGRGHEWRLLLMATVKMEFSSLLVTMESIRAMGPVEMIRVDGLYEDGLFVIDLPASGRPSFRLIGDSHIQ